MPQINPPSSRLRYQQVMDRLEIELTRGKYSTGDKLPSLMDLSKSLKMNHLTIRKGLQELARKGLVDIRPRVGVFVADHRRAPQRKTTRIVLGCRSFMLGISKHHPAVAAYLAGVHAKNRSDEFSIQTMFYHRDHLADDLGSAILAQKIDGFVACGGGVSEDDLTFFARHRIPFVQCGVAPPDDDWSVKIRYSTSRILRQAVEHLRGLGHQRIAFVCWEHSGDGGAIRREFNRLAFDHRLGDSRELLVNIENPEGDARFEQVESFFDLRPLPTAVVVFDEFLADVLLASCDRRGIRVPQDLSVVSLHDSMPFAHRIPLTAPDSVKLNSSLTERAIDTLESWINGQPVTQRDIELNSNLIIKASSGPALAAMGAASPVGATGGS